MSVSIAIMPNDSPNRDALRPHPLALDLIARLRCRPSARLLEVGLGSGRNSRALLDAGFTVATLDDCDDAACAGALSTHALLHGTQDAIVELLHRIWMALEAHGPLYCTFGSVRDARFGSGKQIAERTFAPLDGDEVGVPHTFFDSTHLRELLSTAWTIESLAQFDVDRIAGTWAHGEKPLERSTHFFAKLRRR